MDSRQGFIEITSYRECLTHTNMSQVITLSVSGNPMLCHPVENSQASTDGACDGIILYIDCAHCGHPTNLCRVHIDTDQMYDWIEEYGLKVKGY